MTIFRIIEVQFFGLSVVLKSPACAKLQNVSGHAMAIVQLLNDSAKK
jgi:hypothetical protein